MVCTLRIVAFIWFILCWQNSYGQVTFVIESLPGATPATDTIFICGTFNNWVPNDPDYAFKKQLNGQLAVTIPSDNDTIEYKFTRGSWTKVETDAVNQYTGNRELISKSGKKIFVKIDNWLDMGGARQINYIIFYFFACAFQGIALCLLVYRIHKKDKGKFKSFLVINTVLIALLILLVLHETANHIWQTYFTFIFQISLFCWGPLLMFFFDSFSFGGPFSKLRWYFIPAGIAFFLVVVRILDIRAFLFLSNVVWPPVTWGNAFFIGMSFILNLGICIKMLREFSFLRPGADIEKDAKMNFLYYFFWTSLVALLLIPVHAELIISGKQYFFIEDFQGIAIVLSVLIFIETYFLRRYPEIIKEGKVHSMPTQESQNWSEKLNALMKNSKPYKKADLSVSELAEMLGTKSHVLSRVINDICHKNFRDFVNTYRIEEFIALANTKEFRHYTFLALAQEAGFNSKSTFNLAFKKLTRQSPRSYFKSRALS